MSSGIIVDLPGCESNEALTCVHQTKTVTPGCQPALVVLDVIRSRGSSSTLFLASSCSRVDAMLPSGVERSNYNQPLRWERLALLTSQIVLLLSGTDGITNLRVIGFAFESPREGQCSHFVVCSGLREKWFCLTVHVHFKVCFWFNLLTIYLPFSMSAVLFL